MSRYDAHTDLQLLKLLSQNDMIAFETLYRRHAAGLNRYAHGKTGDRDQAQEVVQEIFVWLWTQRNDLPAINNPKAYLFHMARNRILNVYRSEQVREKYASLFYQFKTNFDQSVEDELNLADLQAVIERKLASLPEKCRTAFRLSRIHNLPISTVAKEMAISRRTVENYLTRALKHLRKTV
ncbi:MAG: RNA polymerase sigma-70 factor [Chryseosolibacter sp.]